MELKIIAWIVAGAAVLGGIGYAVHRHSGAITAVKQESFKAGQSDTQGKWDKEKIAQSTEALQRAAREADETARRLKQQKENDDAQQRKNDLAKADAARLSARADKLQRAASDVASTFGCPVSGDSALECIRKAAATLGNVLGQCGQRHRELAIAADDARIRGQRCEADYDALTPVVN